MAAELFAALQGFKAILDGLKAMSDIRDETMRGNASIELSRQLIDLQVQTMTAHQQNAALVEEVRALKAEIAQLKTQAADLERYELKAVGSAGVAYMLKPAARGAEPPHWLCPTCYANGKKSVLQFSVRMSRGNVFRCTGCDGHLSTNTIPSWSE